MGWNGTIRFEGNDENSEVLVLVRRELRVISHKLKAAGYQVVRATFTHVGSEDLLGNSQVQGDA